MSEPIIEHVSGNPPLNYRCICNCGYTVWRRTPEEAKQDITDHLATDFRHSHV